MLMLSMHSLTNKQLQTVAGSCSSHTGLTAGNFIFEHFVIEQRFGCCQIRHQFHKCIELVQAWLESDILVHGAHSLETGPKLRRHGSYINRLIPSLPESS